MTAQVDSRVIRACERGERPGVLVMVDKPREEVGGVAPLTLDRNLRSLASVTCEVNDALSGLMFSLRHRSDRPASKGIAPLALDTAASEPKLEETHPKALEHLGAIIGAVTADGIAKLAATPGVRMVVPMPRFAPLVEPTAYRLAPPAMLGKGPAPGLVQTGVPALWDKGIMGEGAAIGHLDTGINAKHHAFAKLSSVTYVEFDAKGQEIPGAAARDLHINRHGTHTAGTLVGGDFSGSFFGVAPQGHLYSAGIFPDPAPSHPHDMDEIVVQALNWIVGKRPLVVNLSFGDRKYNDSFIEILRFLVDANIVIVAAVGNEGAGLTTSPGNYLGVISVGAVDAQDRVCDFSGSGRNRKRVRPDLCAPGAGVLSAGRRDDEAALCDGTSMAAPHVAGVIAALRARAPEITPRSWKMRLRRDSRVPNGWDSARGGDGVLDAAQLLAKL